MTLKKNRLNVLTSGHQLINTHSWHGEATLYLIIYLPNFNSTLLSEVSILKM